MKKLLIIIFIFNLIFFISNMKKGESILPAFNELNTIYRTVDLVAVGDNLIHETLYQAAKTENTYDFKPMYAEVKPYIQTFDLAFINQETILGGLDIGLSTYPCFNSPYELGDAIIDAGFNLISVANNHTLDRGEKGVLNAISYFEKQPVIYSGAKDSFSSTHLKLFVLNDIVFAFIAYTYGTNGIPFPDGKSYLANVYSNEKAKEDIGIISKLVDVVIVSMHWGEEYQSTPNTNQITQAQYLASLGADIIIGHHPHVIQPVDLIDSNGHQTIVFYSLGNFLSDQKGIDQLIGIAASLEITKTITGSSSVISFSNLEAKLLYRYKDIYNNTFHIKMFKSLNSSFLDDYLFYFEEKKKLIQSYYKEIIVG